MSDTGPSTVICLFRWRFESVSQKQYEVCQHLTVSKLKWPAENLKTYSHTKLIVTLTYPYFPLGLLSFWCWKCHKLWKHWRVFFQTATLASEIHSHTTERVGPCHLSHLYLIIYFLSSLEMPLFRGFKSVLILFEIDNICSSGALPFSSALLPLRLCADDELCKTHFVLYSVKWITRSIGEKAVPVLGLWGLIEFVLDWMPFCSAVVGSYAWTCRTMLWTFPHGKVCAFSHTRYMY